MFVTMMLMPTPRIHHRDPRSVPSTSILGRLVVVAAIVEPLMTLPQIYQIWSTKNAQGVSLATWAFYVLASLVWLVYGVKTGSKPLALTGALWVVMDLLVVVGVLFWR